MTNPAEPRTIPAAFFGIVLGLAGLGNDWRLAHLVWHLSSAMGETILAAAGIVWITLTAAYIAKWFIARPAAIAELQHAVQCCFVGLIGVSGMLIAGAILPYARLPAEFLFAVCLLYTIVFAVWRTGALWQGGRDPGTTTAVLYLPAVAGSFVTAAVLSAMGAPDWGQYAFGAGLFTWLAIESVLLHRLYTAPELPLALRPTLGIQLAPPTVGLAAYLSVTTGPPGLFARMLLGYGLLQTVLLLRLLPWIFKQSFSPAYWAFSFGVTALAAGPMRMLARGDAGPAAVLAGPLFVGANFVILLLVIGTVRLTWQGRLLPKPVPAT
jgi:tellurite resistance protein